MNTTLIIMAAGIGSRYGKGIKQLAKIGPHDASQQCCTDTRHNSDVFVPSH